MLEAQPHLAHGITLLRLHGAGRGHGARGAPYPTVTEKPAVTLTGCETDTSTFMVQMGSCRLLVTI